MPLAAGQIINNRYRIRNVLGQSRQEAFYSALDISLNSPVVVQEIANTSPDCVQQFGYEARRLSNLRHPSLPYVVDHFSLPGQGQYLILEYIEGQSLQGMISQAGKGLPWARVVSWFGQVGEALAYLHQQTPPVIHGDVKPGNIIIAPSGQAKLVGNGIARSADVGRRETYVADSGLTAFQSPEFYSNNVDVRSDIYSFGASIYATLTGRLPVDSLKRQGGQPLTLPRQINPSIPPGIEQAILKAMNLTPESRFQSIPEMLAALGIVAGAGYPMVGQVAPTIPVSGQKVVEKSSSAPKRPAGWIVGAVGVVLALCLLGGILGGVGLYSYILSPTETEQIEAKLDKTMTAMYLTQLVSPGETLPATIEPSASVTLSPSPTLTTSPTQEPGLTLLPIITVAPSWTPIPSPSFTSAVNPTWVPCPGTYASRLHVNDQAFVSYDPPLANRVRTQPNSVSPVVGFIQPGEKVLIIGGPICSNEWIWWQIRSIQSGMTGWTAEGDKTGYWLVPMP